MRRIFPLGLALLIIAPVMFAQDAGATVNRARQKGLLFTIEGLGNFGVSGNLLGVAVPSGTATSQTLAGLGFKYYLSQKIAVRGALHFGLVKIDTQTAEGTVTAKVTSIGFAPGVEYHFVNTKAVTAYFGGAAAFGLYDSSSPANLDLFSVATTFKGMVYSLALLFGAEFFLAENVSLGAEYQLGANFTSGKTEMGVTVRDLPKTLRLGISALAATLAVYW
jgi:opacity protein-like surface antigen